MAYVIAVCGAGGKTTLVKSLAKKYANENKIVCITTTTHMWYDDDVVANLWNPLVGANKDIVGAKHCEPSRMGELYEPQHGKVYYVANLDRDKITPLSIEDYKKVCDEFDYVIVEADGSKSMPMKIPRMNVVEANLCEPAIPDDADEIIIVVGMEAIGREIGAVCHRFYEFYGNDKYLSDNNIKPKTIVTESLIDDFVNHYYYEPLKKKYSSAKITIYKNDYIFNSRDAHCFCRGELQEPACMDNVLRANDKIKSLFEIQKKFRIAIILCASGFSKRFGSNKLLIDTSDIVEVNKDIVGALQCELNVGMENDDVGANFRSPRMGELYEPIGKSKKLYQLMIDKLLSAKEILINKIDKFYEIKNENKQNLKNNLINENDLLNQKDFVIDVVVISQYDEILNDKNYKDKVIMLRNDRAKEGLSASIKLGVEFCEGSQSFAPTGGLLKFAPTMETIAPTNENDVVVDKYDAVVFVNADLPYLPDMEIANFIFNSVLNKNGISSMYSDCVKNPAYFEKEYFGELLQISGDKGPRELFDKYKMSAYKYYINDKYLIDIDMRKDILTYNHV